MKKKYLIFFGAQGTGVAYMKHTNTKPDYFVDNDKNKWEKDINGVTIKPPNFLKTISKDILKIIITSGYVKGISKELKEMGFNNRIIEVPPKSLLGEHPFISLENRIEAAHFLNSLMEKNFNVVALGGTALGFSRDKTFILWDFDIDLLASFKFKNEIIDFLNKSGCPSRMSGNTIKSRYTLKDKSIVPIAIDLFDPDKKIYIDKYEDHTWEWPTTMFTRPHVLKVHNVNINLPNPYDVYLKGVYGENWKTPNKNFNYYDYFKKKN